LGQVNSTETTPAPAVGGRQVGQLLAGRYRLGLFKGGDDLADVWHALDESTEKVVTLEILRDRDNDAARQRFLAEAQRMAAIERPSVMRVAAIHNEATGTFIVFEHLIPLPVVLTGLSAIAKDVKPATRAAADKTVVLGAVAGPTRSAAPEPPAAPPAAVTMPAVEFAADDASAPTIVDLDEPAPSGASAAATAPLKRDALKAALRSVASTRADAPGFAPLATRMAGVQLVVLARLDALIAAARARLPRRIDLSALTSLVSAAGPRASGADDAATGPAVRLRSAARTAAALGMRAATTAAPILARAASTAAPFVVRARGNQVVMGGVIGSLLLVVFIVSPLDDMIIGALRSSGAPSTKTAAPSGGLAPAPFVHAHPPPALAVYWPNTQISSSLLYCEFSALTNR